MTAKLMGLLIGIGVGIGVTLLFAPRSGQETRNLLSEKAKQGSRYLADQAQNVREMAGNAAGAGREMLGGSNG